MVALESCPLFALLPPRELAGLRSVTQLKHFEDGAEIFKEGDKGDGLYVVAEGMVQITAVVGDKSRHVFSRCRPGDVFGEMAVIDDKTRSASANASGKTAVYFIPREDLLALVGSSPPIAVQLLRDISGRLREFNRQYVNEVLQAERLSLVGRFARSIVHDLKNPLNIISLTAELAGAENASAESRKNAPKVVARQVERITEMINEILEYTQGTQQGAFIPAAVDYAHYVRHLMGEISPELLLKSAKLELENEPPSVSLNLNPKRFQRVFYNLLHNATDAMPRGGRIIMRFQTTETEVITEIEDSGPGIAPEIAGQLFDAFVTFGKAHGTGLGLSICKRIVEDHGGKITARNEPGRGAVFTFTLPRRK
jgi:signal transduction histidine kinase